MAKTALINRNEKRRKTVKKYAAQARRAVRDREQPEGSRRKSVTKRG